MNGEMQIFENPEFGRVRSVMIDGEPWLVGKDVATALGYGKGSSSANAISKYVDDEDKGVTEMMTPGGTQATVIINESGVYSLIMGSKLPTVKRFKRWVTSEVLPALRKTGTYTIPVQDPEDDFDTVCRALRIVDKRAKMLEARNTELETHNAALERKIERDAGKVIWAESMQATEDLMSVGDLAKLLYQSGTKTGQIRLFDRLRKDGYVMRSGNDNVPQQTALERKLLKMVEYKFSLPSGKEIVTKKTMVTPKGVEHFCKIYGGNNRK